MNFSPSSHCLSLIKQFEGFSSRAYKPVPTEKYLTIGYGHYGPEVKKTDTITQAQAELLLARDLCSFARAINVKAQNDHIKLNQNQFDALCSFAFNLGTGALFNSTLWRYLKHGDYAKAAAEFPKWIYAGGKLLRGLVQRRKAEQALFVSEH